MSVRVRNAGERGVGPRLVLRARLSRASRYALVALALGILLARVPPPRTAAIPTSAEPGPADARARAILRAAHAARRDGRGDDAIREYGRVARSANARPVDRLAADHWLARVRLEKGERSALVELERIVEASTEPHYIARSALAAARSAVDFAGRSDARARDDSEAIARRLIATARRRLQVISRLRTDEGARAQRWSMHLERRLAEIFSD